MRSLNIAATGMAAQQLNVEVVSNNIANMNTTGYKRQRAEFQDLVYQNLERMGATSSSSGTIVPSGVQIGAGVKSGAVYRIASQGSLVRTDNKTDIAISGRGYFQIQNPDGSTAYTRAGNFGVDAQGQLVTEDGFLVQPGITVPENALEINISRDGVVEAVLPGTVAPAQIGQLQLANFINPAGLEAIGDNLFLETAASGTPQLANPATDGTGYLLQGFIEASNVDAVAEISALITAQRAYEMNARVITTSDQMLQTSAQLR